MLALPFLKCYSLSSPWATQGIEDSVMKRKGLCLLFQKAVSLVLLMESEEEMPHAESIFLRVNWRWMEKLVARWNVASETFFLFPFKTCFVLGQTAEGTYWRFLCLSAAGCPSESQCSLMHLITLQAKADQQRALTHTRTSILGTGIDGEALQRSTEEEDIGEKNVLLALTAHWEGNQR